jgi:hypothetical protein
MCQIEIPPSGVTHGMALCDHAGSTASRGAYLGDTGYLSQGVQVGRQALRIRHVNGVEVCKKRPWGFE